MYNLVKKDLKLGVSPIFLVMPLLTGALMLIPAWIYVLVPLYFCWITVPNMFAGFKAQNDLLFTTMMPVTKRDMVKARVSVVVLLELLHIGIAMIFGIFTFLLYPDMIYYFFAPTLGFWGVCLAMFGIFNLVFIPMYYKTAYNYGKATFASIAAAMLFAGIAQWVGISNSNVADVFTGSRMDDMALQASILVAGIAIFAAFTAIAYRVGFNRFQKVEAQ
jgi:hypothetical protein